MRPAELAASAARRESRPPRRRKATNWCIHGCLVFTGGGWCVEVERCRSLQIEKRSLSQNTQREIFLSLPVFFFSICAITGPLQGINYLLRAKPISGEAVSLPHELRAFASTGAVKSTRHADDRDHATLIETLFWSFLNPFSRQKVRHLVLIITRRQMSGAHASGR